MAKISVIGLGGNSIFLNVDHFHKKGETIAAQSIHEEFGGKGFNQAVACAKMGAKVSFLCAVGNDDGAEKASETAKKYGVDGYFVKKAEKSTTLAFILTDKKGENQVTVFRNAELTYKDVDDFESEIASSDFLLLQNEVPEDVNIRAVEIAKKFGVKIILNPAPIREISDEIANEVYAVTPNEQENKAIDIKRFSNVITTLGKKGCLINGKTKIKPPKVKAVDTTGAGDTFNGALAVFLAEGDTLETACKKAVRASSLKVTKKYVLDSIPERVEVEGV